MRKRLGLHLVAELGRVRGAVAADAEHLAAWNHRGEQARIVQCDALAGELDRGVQRIAGDDSGLRVFDHAAPGSSPVVNLVMSTRRA